MNKIAIHIFTLALFGVSSTELFAQQAVLSSGGDASGTGGSVSYSIGQAAYTHFTGEDGTISLGVQQPEITIMVATEQPDPYTSASLFPNPTQHTVYLDLGDAGETPDLSKITYRLIDMNGRQINQGHMTGNTTNVNVAELPAASYILQIIDRGQPIKSFTLIKS